MDKMNQIKKEIFTSMKMMDTTIKGVKESEEYKIAQAYNQGLRDAMASAVLFYVQTPPLLQISYIKNKIKEDKHMKFYHGTSIENLLKIVHDGGFDSKVSNWLVSDSTRVYMASVGQDYWDYSDKERQEYAEDFEDELREAFETAIGNAQIAAAVVGSVYNSVAVFEFEIPDNIVMEYVVDDDSVENARGCYEIVESDLNKLIIDGTIKVYTHQLLGAYKPYARVFYLPVENRFFNESEVPDDVMKLAWLVKDLFPDDLFDYEEDVKNAGFTLDDKDWKPEGGQAA